MPAQLPLVGVKAIVEGYAAFQKQIADVNAKIAESGKAAAGAAKQGTAFTKFFGDADKAVSAFTKQLSGVVPGAGAADDAISGVLTSVLKFSPAALAATAGALALAGGFLALGQRGAALTGLADSFDRLTASVGVSSQTLLKDLRAAAAGTVSDFDLIRQANVALAGAAGQFGQEFGKNLPKILEIARVQARATGQDVGFLFQSLVTGIKRASPLLIDNTGLVLKIGEANKAYAEQLGKTVEQLTEEEKQIAVLNATLEAGQTAINALGGANETAAEKIARGQAIITNSLDALALAVQPAFGQFLDVINRILAAVQTLVVGLAPILGSIASIIIGVFSGIANTVLSILEPIINAIAPFLPYIAILFEGIANIVNGVFTIIQKVVAWIVNFIRAVAKNLFGLDIDNLGKSLFEGAARAFGSFANGILKVANELIFPAIIGIAKFIADFLIGQSPPPQGPLSEIDTGGANLMTAWLQGIAGVSLDPVAKVTAEVNAILGNIGKASLSQVNARLAQLDKALLPFQNRLDIVKAQFESIAEPAKAALDAIDRQIQEAEAALAMGDTAAAERIRLLDAQRASIEGVLAAEQARVDAAQIQFALAKAQQAPERALLEIRKRQLEALIKGGKSPKTAAEKALTEPKLKGGAGAAQPTSGIGGAPALGALPTDTTFDLLSGKQAVEDAKQGIAEAFAGEIDTSQLLAFGENTALLREQLGRLGSVDIGGRIGEIFSGVADIFNPDVEGSPANAIRNAVTTLTAGAETPGSIAWFFSGLPDNISNAAPGLGTAVSDLFTNIFDPEVEGSPASVARQLVSELFGEDAANSIFAPLENFDIGIALGTFKDDLLSFFTGLFDPMAEGSVEQQVGLLLNNMLNPEVEGSIPYMFAQLPANVAEAASGLFDQLQTNVFDPVAQFLTGEGEGTLSAIIATAVAFFASIPQSVIDVLKGFAVQAYTALVLPVINAVNSIIGTVEGAVRIVAGAFAEFLADVLNSLDTTDILGTNLGSLVPQSVRDLYGQLSAAASGFSLGRLSTAIPDFLAAPGAAEGGRFSGGLLQVGERGREFIAPAGAIDVFPNEFVQALEMLTAVMAQPAALPVGGDTYNTSNQTYNFNGVASDNDARRRFNQLRARM